MWKNDRMQVVFELFKVCRILLCKIETYLRKKLINLSCAIGKLISIFAVVKKVIRLDHLGSKS